jgi:hypothetical protein
MTRTSRKYDRRRQPAGVAPKLVKWIGAAAALALVVYGLSQMSSVAYNDTDIRVVDFSALTSREKRTALEAANQARCSCSCGMNVAQCVATDMTCPLRDENIRSIRTMAREADQP